jgi:lysophospholipase
MNEISLQKINILNHSILVRKLEVKNPRAGLFIAHGYAEHSGRYEHVMKFLKEQRVNTYALDQLGHGESSGVRGYVRKFSDYGDIFQKFVERQLKQIPNLPIFILGHSFGALVFADLLKRYPKAIDLGFTPSGIIFTSPFWWLKNRSLAKLTLGRVLSYLRPTFIMPSAIDPFILTHDRECALNYASDPLVIKGVNANWFRLAMEKQSELRESPFNQDWPILTLLAGDDRLSDSAVAVEIMKNLPSTKKEFKVYDNTYHEILNESEKDLVMKEIGDFITRVCLKSEKPVHANIERNNQSHPREQAL